MSKVDGPRPLVLIVTCEKSPPARVVSAREQLTNLGLDIDVEVVMGFVKTDPIVDEIYDARRNRRCMKRPLSRTEIAIYASHRKAWQFLGTTGRQGALILEDDFGIADIETVTAALEQWPDVLGGGRDMVKLFDFEKRRRNRVAFGARVGALNLVKWRAPSAGMVAYFITAHGAEKFLSRPRVFRQIDEDIKFFWELDLDIWSIPGNPICENSATLGGSLVEAERQSLRKKPLWRSIWGNLITADRKLRTRWHLFRESQRRRPEADLKPD